MKLLIIDSNLGKEDAVVAWLVNDGFDVECAVNGEEGMALLRMRHFDLLILEIIVPVKDGIEILISLRKNHCSTPVIAISGGGRIGPDYYLKLADFFGADRTLEKPLERRKLVDTINELLPKGTSCACN